MLGWPRWRRASAHSAESYACLPIAHGDGEIACPRSRSDALIERSPQRRQHVAPRLHRLRRVQGAKTDRLYAEVLDAIARGDSVTSRPARRIERTAETSSYLLIFSAPSRTRTDTGRILSPLPLPIGLWGPQVPCATERKGRVPGHTADAAELATPEGEPPDWVTG
jgi:hypothetical protein